MAKRYGELVQDLWSGNHKSIIPLKFRVCTCNSVTIFSNIAIVLNIVTTIALYLVTTIVLYLVT